MSEIIQPLILPSWDLGNIAHGPEDAAYPELWEGLIFYVDPTLGPFGLDLIDIVGGNNGDLSMVAADAWVVGERGYALDYDGSGDVTTLTNYDLTSNWTIVFWAFGRNAGLLGPFGSMILGNTDNGNDFFYMAAGLRARFENSAGANVGWVADLNFLNIWRFVALVADTTGIDLYLDGVSQGRQTIDPTLKFYHLGSGHINPDFDFDGLMGLVSLYNVTLPENHIQLMAAGATPAMLREDAILKAPAVGIPLIMQQMDQYSGGAAL